MGTGVPSSLLSPVHLRIQAVPFDVMYNSIHLALCQHFLGDFLQILQNEEDTMFIRGTYPYNHSVLRQIVGTLLCLLLLSMGACGTASSSVQARPQPAETAATHTTRHSI